MKAILGPACDFIRRSGNTVSHQFGVEQGGGCPRRIRSKLLIWRLLGSAQLRKSHSSKIHHEEATFVSA